MLWTYKYNSPIGEMILLSDGKNLTGLWFLGQKYFGYNINKNHNSNNNLSNINNKKINNNSVKNIPENDIKLKDCFIDDNNSNKMLPIFQQTIKWLDNYFSGEKPNFTPPILLQNISPFRKYVLELLLEIPYGTTTTYKNIAKIIENKTNKKVSCQAVGGAVSHNPISIIIPCHRVISSSQNLTGYAGGINKKIKLLEIENLDISKFKIPKN